MIPMLQYEKAPVKKLGQPGAVVPWKDGVIFRCPCGERQVYVASPPHAITFADDGRLTLDGSVGSRADASRGRPANWCHFHVKNGDVTMCEGSACPGRQVVSRYEDDE